MPYNPTWNNPYLSQNPYQPVVPSTTQQAMPYQQVQQPVQYQQARGVKVDGPSEAMSRFLMMYPANQLVPGFVSEPPLFDVNGRQFYTLSIENDGRRNLETFDYSPHVDKPPVQIDGAQFVSRQEFDEFAAKVNAVIGATNGIYGPISAGTISAATSDRAEGENVNAKADDAGGQLGNRQQPRAV